VAVPGAQFPVLIGSNFARQSRTSGARKRTGGVGVRLDPAPLPPAVVGLAAIPTREGTEEAGWKVRAGHSLELSLLAGHRCKRNNGGDGSTGGGEEKHRMGPWALQGWGHGQNRPRVHVRLTMGPNDWET
jgi:hypothetical protein